jgi:hypothetical protein
MIKFATSKTYKNPPQRGNAKQHPSRSHLKLTAQQEEKLRAHLPLEKFDFSDATIALEGSRS